MKTNAPKPNKMLAVWTAADRELSRDAGREPKVFARRYTLRWLSDRIAKAIEPKPGFYDVVEAILRYEDGRMTEEEVVEMFQVLVSTGMIGSLQGSYQRTAGDLIRAGLVQVN